MAAECAGREGKFWQLHDLAFRNQRALAESTFVAWATELGLEPSRYKTCLSDNAVRKRVEADLQSAEGMRIASTPTLLLGTVQSDGMVRLREVASPSFRDLERAVQRFLAGRENRPGTKLVGYGAAVAGVAILGATWFWRRSRRRQAEPVTRLNAS